MLVSSNDIMQFAIQATDGQQGRCEDLYFDEGDWSIRYLVTKSGFLFNYRQSLVKASVLGQPDIERRLLPVSLTKEQIDKAEDPGAHPPVGEQRMSEIRRNQFQQWPPLMLGVPGAAYTPVVAEEQLLGSSQADEEEKQDAKEDPHLRSISEVTGYTLLARDGDAGSISDFLIDPADWTVRFLVADTGAWLPGQQFVVKTEAVSAIDWSERSVKVVLAKAEVEAAPEMLDIQELERSDSLMGQAPIGVYGM